MYWELAKNKIDKAINENRINVYNLLVGKRKLSGNSRFILCQIEEPFIFGLKNQISEKTHREMEVPSNARFAMSQLNRRISAIGEYASGLMMGARHITIMKSMKKASEGRT